MDDLEAVQRGAPSHYPMGKKKKRGGRKKAPKAASPPVPTPGQPVDTDAGPQTAGLPTPVPDNDLSSVTSSCEADRSESVSRRTSPANAESDGPALTAERAAERRQPWDIALGGVLVGVQAKHHRSEGRPCRVERGDSREGGRALPCHCFRQDRERSTTRWRGIGPASAAQTGI